MSRRAYYRPNEGLNLAIKISGATSQSTNPI